MAYRIEMGVDVDEGLYLELAIGNVLSGGFVAGDGVDHRLNVYGFARDYGCAGTYGQTVASNSNGMITCPERGILSINVPTCALLFGGQFIPAILPDVPAAPAPLGSPSPPPNQGAPIPPPYAPYFPVDLKRSLHAKLLAVPLANPTFTKTLATLVLSLGGSMNPRLTLMTYPLYPNSPTALPPPTDRYAMEKAINAYGPTAQAGGVDAMIAFADARGATAGSNTRRALDAACVAPGGDYETLLIIPFLTALPPAGLGLPDPTSTLLSLRTLAGQQTSS